MEQRRILVSLFSRAGKMQLLQGGIGIWIFIAVTCCSTTPNPSQETTIIQQPPPKKDTIPVPPLSELMGHFDPALHPDFVLIDSLYTDRKKIYMRREAYESFKAMHAAALQEGFEIRIQSATRNFDYQKGIWTAKWKQLSAKKKTYMTDYDKARTILLFTSMPGTSRHHWGTDIDLNQLTDAYFNSGKGKEIYNWLQMHASEYGFCQVYGPKGVERSTGYEEEKWHWSYMPLSGPYLSTVKYQLQDSLISGFPGAKTAMQIGIKEKYILGIQGGCK